MSSGESYSAIVFGGTGACGRFVIQSLIESPLCENATVVSRRPLAIEDPKLTVVLWDDFEDRLNDPQIEDRDTLETFAGHDVCFSCLGLPSTSLPKDRPDLYELVNQTWALSVGRFCLAADVPGHYFISSVGAKASSWFQYMRMKGIAEETLSAVGLERLVIVRPSLLVVDRGDNWTMGEEMGKVFIPLMDFFGWTTYSITVESVGQAMVAHYEQTRPRRGVEDAPAAVALLEVAEMKELLAVEEEAEEEGE